MNRSQKKSPPLLLASLALLALVACQPKPEIKEPSFYDEWKVKSETAQPYLTKAQKPSGGQIAALSQAPEIATEKTDTGAALKDLPTHNITVRFVAEDIANVLRALGRMANQNIMINPSVAGTVNAHITDTPWDQVFLGFINSFNLILNREGSLLRVMTLDDAKKQVERDALQQEKEQVSPLVTRLIPVEFSNPEEISPSITPMLSKDKAGVVRGAVAVDKHSRSLVVTDVEENMARITSLVEQLDKPTPQILIEAHIVETTQDIARELGVQWGGDLANNTGRDQVGLTSEGILNSARIDGLQPAEIIFHLVNGNGNFLDLQLSALQRQGKANILSQPSIVTLDNNEAIIESGREIPFQTMEDGTFKIAYKEATLKLIVTPHVINNRLIKLNIHAKKDEVDFTTPTASGDPTIIKKQAQTQLIVENGATVVIAGLSKETVTKGNTSVPWFAEIPGLHWLFSNDSKSNEFEEVLIFISPKILLKQMEAANTAPGK